MNKAPKTVLITGSSSGFGRLTARLFQQNGWNVIATMRSPEKEPEFKTSESTLIVRLDVTDVQSIKNAIEEGIAKFGKIDALVNNAGYGAFGFLEEASPEEVASQMDVNLIGVINVLREVIPHMRQNRSGRIINVTSIAGSVGVPLASLYNASKFAVEGLTHSLAFELEEFGIKVATVAPGAFRTNFINAINLVEGNKKSDLTPYRNHIRAIIAKRAAQKSRGILSGDANDVARIIYKFTAGRCPRNCTNFIGRDAKLASVLKKFMPERALRWAIKKKYPIFFKA